MYREYFKYSILSFVRTPGERRNLFLLFEIAIKRCLKQKTSDETSVRSYRNFLLTVFVLTRESTVFLLDIKLNTK